MNQKTFLADWEGSFWPTLKYVLVVGLEGTLHPGMMRVFGGSYHFINPHNHPEVQQTEGIIHLMDKDLTTGCALTSECPI